MVIRIPARRPPLAASARCPGCHSNHSIEIEEAIALLRRQSAEQIG